MGLIGIGHKKPVDWEVIICLKLSQSNFRHCKLIVLKRGEWQEWSEEQCDQIWHNFAALAKLEKVFGIFQGLFPIWQNLKASLAKELSIGQIFFVVGGQIFKSYLAIWSHWRRAAYPRDKTDMEKMKLTNKKILLLLLLLLLLLMLFKQSEINCQGVKFYLSKAVGLWQTHVPNYMRETGVELKAKTSVCCTQQQHQPML